MSARDELAKLPELLRRVRRGPLEDPELLQITLEVLIAKMIEDRRRARRQTRTFEDEEEEY